MLLNNWRKDLRKLLHLFIFLVFCVFFSGAEAVAGEFNSNDTVFDAENYNDFKDVNAEVILTKHAKQRAEERGTNEDEIRETILEGRSSPAKNGRLKFEKLFSFDSYWNDKYYKHKKLEVIAVKEDGNWIAITVITKFF